ncbi:50S ribosomal protein L31 [Candidatus Dojkabacteria bacterium]|nr:50S ribosomal protein L31 [Candidatus Dojkabacteria bacterium]
MKKNIHPTWNKTKVTCNCGAVFTIGTTISEFTADICSKCHPAFKKGGANEYVVDRDNRIEQFKARMEKSATLIAEREKAKKVSKTKSSEPKSVEK